MITSLLRSVVITLFGLLTLSSTVSAQKNRSAVLHFPTDDYHLSVKHMHHLDSIISTLRNIPEAYQFSIIGHTDSVGSSLYNNSLSYKRAAAVADFLSKKGFSQLKLQGKGYSTPVASNESEQNKEKNRRVEVNFQLTLPNVKPIAGLSNKTESLSTSDAGGTIITSTGTKITFQPEAFMDANGRPVKGKVDVQYIEYREPVDFLLAGIPMHVNGPGGVLPFNSGGMFTINASQANSPVYLRQGKAANVAFNYDGSIPNQNFYLFDSTARAWRQIRNMSSRSMLIFPGDCLGTYTPTFCQRDSAFRTVYTVYAGLKYSKESDSSFVNLAKAMKVHDSYVVALKQGQDFKKKADFMVKKYRIDFVRQNLISKEKFRIYQAKGKTDHTTLLLENVSFKKNFKAGFIDSLDQLVFDRFTIHHSADSGYTLTFINRVQTLRVSGIEIQADQKTKDFTAAKWVDAFTKKYAAFESRLGVIRDSVTVLVKMSNTLSDEIKQLLPGGWPSLDTLDCFRKQHDNWVAAETKKLNRFDWLIYYSKNKASFSTIYEKIKQSPEFPEMAKAARNQLNIEAVYRNPLAKLNLSSADVAMPGNFTLTSLGTYNCDQINRLEDPINLYVNYRNPNGEEIKPVIAYLIDNKLNGLLTFDGNFGLSPYQIAFNPKSTTRMVVIDVKGDSYLVPPEAFAKLDKSFANSKYIFTAKKIEKANNKDELKTLLNL